MKKTGLAVLAFLLTAIINQKYNDGCNGNVFVFDASGHYLYLPAVLEYGDLGKLQFYEQVDSLVRPSGDGKWYGLHYQEKTGRRLNKYPPGLAIAELPFYLGARLSEWGEKRAQPYGYAAPYKKALGLASLVWSALGLLVLGAFLKSLWGANTAALTVLLIGLGTNLYTYTITHAGYAHTFSFLLFALLLWNTLRWHTTTRPRHLYFLALVCGWIFLCRPPNVLVFMLPLVWGVYSRATLRAKYQKLAQQGAHVGGALLLFAAVCSINFMYWKYTTGEFFHYSYEGEGFDFRHPQIWKGLFSWEKGWFLYTPVAFLGVMGFVPLFQKQKGLALWTGIYFAVVIYFTFSWVCWYYGWTFGTRPLIETLAILSIPLAALIQWVLCRNWGIKLFMLALCGFLMWMNIYQSNQYIRGALPGGGITREYYFRAWNRMRVSEEDRKLLSR